MPRDRCQLLIAGLLVLALPAIAQDRFILRLSAGDDITELGQRHALTVVQQQPSLLGDFVRLKDPR